MTQLSREEVLTVCLLNEEALPGATASNMVGTSVDSSAVSIEVGQTDLRLPPELINRIAAALVHSNVRIVGAPGTGKSTLAKAVLRAIVGDEAVFTVATSQWTSEDVIGGPIPDPQNPQALIFRPGLVLAAAENGKWVAIDEINRADIDAAFGELFGLLSGFSLELPYSASSADPHSRVFIHAVRPPGDLPEGQYGLPADWRMLATMNSWDKTSLNRVSFAFSRRWCTVYVPIPDPIEYGAIVDEILTLVPTAYSPELRAALEILFVSAGSAETPTLRSIGFAIGAGIARSMIIDIAAMIDKGISSGDAFSFALDGFLLPQLEGALERHDDLLEVLKRAMTAAGTDSAYIETVTERLAVFTGRDVGTSPP